MEHYRAGDDRLSFERNGTRDLAPADPVTASREKGKAENHKGCQCNRVPKVHTDSSNARSEHCTEKKLEARRSGSISPQHFPDYGISESSIASPPFRVQRALITARPVPPL